MSVTKVIITFLLLTWYGVGAQAINLKACMAALGIVSGKVTSPPPIPPPIPYRLPTTKEGLDAAFGAARDAKFLRIMEEKEMMKDSFWPTGTPYGPSRKINLLDFKPNKRYLWIIAEDGSLVIGQSKILFGGSVSPGSETVMFDNLGHPGLMGMGKLGRIAGELLFEPGEKGKPGNWVINDQSGRYFLTDGQYESRMQNVKKLFRASGLPVLLQQSSGH